MRRVVRVGAAGAALVCVAAQVGVAAAAVGGSGGSGPASTGAATRFPVCRSWTDHRPLAARISSDILAAVRHRRAETPVVAVRVDDPALGIGCWLNAREHFDSASVVKVVILGALLRKAHVEHRKLTRHERALAWLMITHSDNDAASALWDDVGMFRLQRFLDLTGMMQTRLNPAWGLTRITAHDETVLLKHLLAPNPVLTNSARDYALWLMAHVTRSQRWGVPVGVPDSYTVHVKNGWAPLPFGGSPWWVNSIGCFTHGSTAYTVVVLTGGNADAGTGIRTIEDIADRINRALNSGAKAVVPFSKPDPSWRTPDEPVPPHPA